MANYSRIGARSPLPGGQAPSTGGRSYGPQSYTTSASGSSAHGQYAPIGGGAGPQRYANGNPHSAGASTRSGATSGLGVSASSIGGREYGPYSPLNRRGNNGGNTTPSEDDRSTGASSKERLMKKGGAAGRGAAGGYTAGRAEPNTYKNAEPDDWMHDPRGAEGHSSAVSLRGFLNVLTLFILVLALLMLFAGYPVIYHVLSTKNRLSGYGLGGSNGTGQVASLSAIRPLIDPDTPASAKTWKSPVSGTTYNLQFSDEFETEGRTFWPGDDQYWEAVDLWYGGTFDLEWYTPEAINTTGGALQITMTDIPSHNLNFQSGMLQSWNKLCFQGGYIEFSLIQPGSQSTQGYWPAAWLMGNLGRPGYMATTDGMWPYSYSACDTGILPNQTNAQGGPIEAVQSTAQYADNGRLSKLPGMKTPSCTCPGEDHPGPNVNTARSSPELDILEAQIQTKGGAKHSFASQSLQTAPFDDAYYWVNTTPAAVIHNTTQVTINSYVGGPFQEAVSSVAEIPARGFQLYDAPDAEKYTTFGVEYLPDWDLNGGGFINWYVDGKPTWSISGAAVPPREVMQIGQRHIPVEPMSIIMNLGMSPGFQTIDFDPDTGVVFPAVMKFDYVRVFQQKGQEALSCDPDDYPTSDYIKNHPEPYNNQNLTTWNKTTYSWPRNSLRSGC
jgi:beta-glucan synthesis-associated protein KRE6